MILRVKLEVGDGGKSVEWFTPSDFLGSSPTICPLPDSENWKGNTTGEADEGGREKCLLGNSRACMGGVPS